MSDSSRPSASPRPSDSSASPPGTAGGRSFLLASRSCLSYRRHSALKISLAVEEYIQDVTRTHTPHPPHCTHRVRQKVISMEDVVSRQAQHGGVPRGGSRLRAARGAAGGLQGGREERSIIAGRARGVLNSIRQRFDSSISKPSCHADCQPEGLFLTEWRSTWFRAGLRSWHRQSSSPPPPTSASTS